jgi:hypothetical protein
MGEAFAAFVSAIILIQLCFRKICVIIIAFWETHRQLEIMKKQTTKAMLHVHIREILK